MKKPLITAAALDYFKTRKRLWLKLLTASVPAIAVGVALRYIAFKQTVDINGNPVAVDISGMFKDFVNVQISAVAISLPNARFCQRRHALSYSRFSGRQDRA